MLPGRGDLLQPFEHGRFVLRGRADRRGARGGCSRRASSGRSRRATTRRSRPGTGSCSPRWPRPAGGSSGTTSSTRPRGWPSSCSGRSPTASACTAPSVPGAPRAPATSRTTPTSRTACTSCTSRRATSAGCEEARRLALLAVELFADDERGGFFLTPSDAEQLVVRKKELDDHPTPSGNSMLAFVLLRLARIYGDDELERRAVSVLPTALPGLPARALRRRPCAVRARPVLLTAAGDRDRRRPAGRGRRAPRSGRSSRTRSSPSARPRTCRCWRGRTRWTAARPSTCASASRARRRSRTGLLSARRTRALGPR